MKILLKVIAGPHEGRCFEFDSHNTFLVGRASYAHFRLSSKDCYFSRAHFLVEVNPPLCRLMDMGSTNGTYLNGKKVTEGDLVDGDRIEGGDTVLEVRIESPNSARAAQVDSPSPLVVSHSRQTMLESTPFADLEPNESAIEPPRHTVMEPVSRQAREKDASVRPDIRQTMKESPATPFIPNSPRGPSENPSPPESDFDLAVPGPFGKYQLMRKLGAGQMGAVYLALDSSSGQTRALKIIRPQVMGRNKDVERFLREAALLCRFHHPRIVQFHEQGHWGEYLYLATEYVPGMDAARFLRRKGRLGVRAAVSIISQVLMALEYAHGMNVVHRDIKPENILIAKPGEAVRVKLADFGLARVYQASTMSGLTMQGHVGGSLAFAAPEQLLDFRNVDPRGDIYSVAASLYTLLTGELIYHFPGPVHEKILMILQEDPVPIQSRRPDLPPPLAAIIHQALSRDPEKRFPTASAFQQALAPYLK